MGRAGPGRRDEDARSRALRPGPGHPVHKVEDPRTPVLLRIAEEEGLRRPHLRLFEAVGRVHEQVLGRRLPLNGRGMRRRSPPTSACRSSCCGLRPPGLGRRVLQLAEERRRLVGMDVYLAVDRGAYLNRHLPTRLSPPTLASISRRRTHGHRRRRHRLDAPPLLLPCEHVDGADRPPFADEWVEKIEQFRETLTRARPDVLLMVGSDHFHQLWLDNMPQFLVGKAPFCDANFANEEREFAADDAERAGGPVGACCAAGTRGSALAFSNELRIDHSITCPIYRCRGRRRTCRSCRSTPTFAPPMPQPERFVELGRTLRRLVEAGRRTCMAIVGTATCRSSSAVRASSGRMGRTRSSTGRRSSGSPPATSRAASAR